jgi:hypothetical protein
MMRTKEHARTGRAVRLSGLVVVLGLAGGIPAGCADQPADNSGGKPMTSPAKPEIPPGAIKVGDDLYYVPLPDPVQGCPAYRQFSPTKLVTAAIYFRAGDGSFTLDRNRAVCD